MNTTAYVYDDSDLTGVANQVKDMLIAQLFKDGHIPDADISTDYAVVMVTKGLFGKWLEDWWGVTEKSRQWRIVRIIKDPSVSTTTAP